MEFDSINILLLKYFQFSFFLWKNGAIKRVSIFVHFFILLVFLNFDLQIASFVIIY